MKNIIPYNSFINESREYSVYSKILKLGFSELFDILEIKRTEILDELSNIDADFLDDFDHLFFSDDGLLSKMYHSNLNNFFKFLKNKIEEYVIDKNVIKIGSSSNYSYVVFFGNYEKAHEVINKEVPDLLILSNEKIQQYTIEIICMCFDDGKNPHYFPFLLNGKNVKINANSTLNINNIEKSIVSFLDNPSQNELYDNIYGYLSNVKDNTLDLGGNKIFGIICGDSCGWAGDTLRGKNVYLIIKCSSRLIALFMYNISRFQCTTYDSFVHDYVNDYNYQTIKRLTEPIKEKISDNMIGEFQENESLLIFELTKYKQYLK